MDLFTIISILITLSAVFSYINHRYIHLPNTIGLMLIALLLSLALILLDRMGVGVRPYVDEILWGIDFNKVLMHGMLSFLLFAGALQTG